MVRVVVWMYIWETQRWRQGEGEGDSFITFGLVRGACVRSATAECVWWGRTHEGEISRQVSHLDTAAGGLDAWTKEVPVAWASPSSAAWQWAMGFFIYTRWRLARLRGFGLTEEGAAELVWRLGSSYRRVQRNRSLAFFSLLLFLFHIFI